MNPVVRENLRDAIATLNQAASLESEMIAAADAISKTLLSGEKLMACGNGGSAADASHLTTEFVCRFNHDRRPYPAISLAVHGGDLTAIGNDYSFDDVFARQIQAFGKPGDVLTAFTTSGRSENVRRALVAAIDRKMKTIAFLGRDGGTCAGLADIELLVTGSVIARIQEGHQFLFHTICEMVEERLQTQG
jgi:D-sedoheptulose 7-phosphate isomerase